MNNINKTLYIPLYGKAFVSKKGIILKDKKAEEIWAEQTLSLKRKSKSKWLAYYMAMRSAVFDKWVTEKLSVSTPTTVLHLGCGLDSRICRVSQNGALWYDVDFPAVIQERKRYYQETNTYHMLAADITAEDWLMQVPQTEHAVVILEGVSMYVSNEQLAVLCARLTKRFPTVSLLVDCYTPFAAKMSKIKNPVNDVGVTKVYGIATPTLLEQDTGLTFIQERSLTPKSLINELRDVERRFFSIMYTGKLSKKLYKLYEYKKQ